jgi:hypothetical protein
MVQHHLGLVTAVCWLAAATVSPEEWIAAPNVDHTCDMLSEDARLLSPTALATRLSKAREPVIVRHLLDEVARNWSGRVAFLQRHGDTRIVVGTLGTLGVDWNPAERHPAHPTMPLAQYAASMRDADVTGWYVFADVSHTTLAAELHELTHLFGRAVGRQLPAPGLEGSSRRSALRRLPASAFGGVPHLAMGGDGSGGALHEHGAAVAGCLVGIKRWLVRRPSGHGPARRVDEG